MADILETNIVDFLVSLPIVETTVEPLPQNYVHPGEIRSEASI